MAEKKKSIPSSDAKKERATAQSKKDKAVKYKQKEEYEEEPEAPKSTKGRTSAGSSNSKKQKKEPVKVVEENERARKAVHRLMPFVLMLVSLFMVICFFMIDIMSNGAYNENVGVAGNGLRNVLCGLFGPAAFLTPVVLALIAVGWRRAVEKNALLAKNLYGFFAMVMASGLMHAILHFKGALWAEGTSFGEAIKPLWELGVSLKSGGFVGGVIGELLQRYVGNIGVVLVTVLGGAIFTVFLCGLTPGYVATAIRYRYKIWREKQDELAMERREERQAAREAAEEEALLEKQARREQREVEAAERRARRDQLALEEAERESRKKLLAAQKEEEKKEEKRKKEEEKRLEEEKKKEEEAKREEEKKKAEEAKQEEEKKKQEEASKEPAPLLLTPSEPEEEPKRPVEQPAPPALIIPPASENDTKKKEEDLSADQDEGVFHSAHEIQTGKKEEKNEAGFSLNEIFATDKKPLSPEEKAKLERAPVKGTDEEQHSEVDMTLLEQMKEISDVDEIPEIEDGIEEIAVEIEEESEVEYVFPPVSMLAEDKNDKDEDVTEELVANAQKLMDTLKSFKVGIKEITYSRGPTITRYELKPDVGIRVRSIANLVDDIALSLATTGVRIEAPIPNKPAVGIEVPNKNANTVYLRSLIDSEKFAGESSKLTACLGADVAGKPMYFNIAKMPHLLIAGATGMGKSVCINSIIVSLLYKARPDEVKLILIDPKKVEFNIYKDIPHLYAPIVSEPTKAAGALASAVAEMERRFELIEEVGVRDIYNYNAVTKDDPDREFMPQMVIIIDELADLMMTAADSVESSICRLAQKARAAGIHIIIGTQRPSVDVITGLIKANVPSRIAFTVASQVDSRTIIDIAGAEKLIGRGDMLFAPVGSAKPMRVQGAFVSESEVEKIVEFIKANNRSAKYNDEFMSRIEEEAAKCAAGGKKGSGGGGGGAVPDGDMDADGLDPKFREAVKVAVETGRVATSLLQRKLEIGYGRAAKIIDQMEEMGYVSAAEGNKPRKILISKEDFMQMTINDDI